MGAQRLLVLLVVALPACHIADQHFTGLGDASGDGVQSDARTDGSSATMAKAYLFDNQAGIYQLAKAATGTLAVANPIPTPAGFAVAGATNLLGTHLYVLDATAGGPSVRDFTINSDGSLTVGSVITLSSGTLTCTPRYAALHPTGSHLAIGCSTGAIAIVPVGSNGMLGQPQIIAAGVAPKSVAWSPNGNCLYAADSNGPSSSLVLSFTFNNGILSGMTGTTGPSVPTGVAVHPNGNTLYVVGSAQVLPYTLDAASCTPTPSTMFGGALGGNTKGVTIDRAGTHLFATATDIYAFTIAQSGALTPVNGSPFVSTQMVIEGAIMDPALPNILYVTGSQFHGALVLTIDAAGAVTQTSSISVGGATQWLQLAP